MQTFEYMQLSVDINQGAPEYWLANADGNSLEWGKALDLYGKDGWELVTVVPVESTNSNTQIRGALVAMFKRPAE